MESQEAPQNEGGRGEVEATTAELRRICELEQESWNFLDWNSPSDSPRSALESSTATADVDSDEGSANDEAKSVEPTSFSSTGNAYIDRILRNADLKILQPGLVGNAYESIMDKEAKLFHLFITKDYITNMAKWANELLLRKGRKACTPIEYMAYMGLELGMSLVKFNEMKKYWARGSFLGHETFRDTMSRKRFLEIRSCVRFYSQEEYDPQTASEDPLWLCRSLLEQFQRKSASLAVPVGVSALDENSCATKARTKAKTYSPNKPAKYAIRFYAVVGHKYCYLSSMFDNRAGNTTGIPAVVDYHRLFRQLRTPYRQCIDCDKTKDSLANTPSALWICMMGHQTKSFKQQDGAKRYFFTDNYYTRHIVATTLKKFTDNEARIIGTVKFTNVDGTNRYHLSKAMELMKDMPRGSWALVQCFDKHPDYERMRSQHASQQRRVRASDRTPFVPPLSNAADRVGYIVFKDSKVVIFYSNDLVENPEEPILLSTDERAVRCVGGLARISRWTGAEVLHRTDFMVAAPVVAYNMFMNGVDRMDQYRATLATQRKEISVHMTIFTFIMDLCITQAFALYRKMCDERGARVDSYFNFKRNICSSLISPWRNSRARTPQDLSDTQESLATLGESITAASVTTAGVGVGRVTIESTLGVMNEAHMLVENLPRKTNVNAPQDIDCFLCRRMGKEMKTIYSCIQCRKGFHVNCFTAFHYRGVLSNRHSALLDVVFNSDAQPTVGKPSQYAPTSTSHMRLPAEKDSLFTRALIRTKANAQANVKRRADNKEIRIQRQLVRHSRSL
jgi:hypothetical protein